MTPADLLTLHKRDLETMIAANRGCARSADRVGRHILDGLNRQGGRYLLRIAGELRHGIEEGPYGTLGRWGKNGFGPAIESLVRESEIQRRLAREAVTKRIAA